jgi:hypothetical protein
MSLACREEEISSSCRSRHAQCHQQIYASIMPFTPNSLVIRINKHLEVTRLRGNIRLVYFLLRSCRSASHYFNAPPLSPPRHLINFIIKIHRLPILKYRKYPRSLMFGRYMIDYGKIPSSQTPHNKDLRLSPGTIQSHRFSRPG